MFIKKLYNFEFRAPSRRRGKKYDVYDENGRYITSFGSLAHQQFHDRIGAYKHLDSNDPNRRRLYRLRHKNDNYNDPAYPSFYSWHFLW
jgi:hypothetical protein